MAWHTRWHQFIKHIHPTLLNGEKFTVRARGPLEDNTGLSQRSPGWEGAVRPADAGGSWQRLQPWTSCLTSRQLHHPREERNEDTPRDGRGREEREQTQGAQQSPWQGSPLTV